jgi:hypothetical protein
MKTTNKLWLILGAANAIMAALYWLRWHDLSIAVPMGVFAVVFVIKSQVAISRHL